MSKASCTNCNLTKTDLRIIVFTFSMKAGEPILGFPMNDSKSLIGSLKLQRKQADM